MAASQLIPVENIYSKCSLPTHVSQDEGPTPVIRIVELLPARSHSDPIRATLVVEALGNAPFEAVSYTWHGDGDPDIVHLQHGVYISKHEVTANLASALRQFRRKRRRRRLWIDAIAINQGDNVEKSAQVRVMGSIYKRATRVLVWLGPGSEAVPDAKDDMMALVDTAERHNVRSRSHTVERTMPNNRHNIRIGSQTEEPYISVGDSVYPYQAIQEACEVLRKGRFESIFGCPWFTRLWVLQEVTLAKHVSLHLGFVQMEWEHFVHAMTLAKATYEKTSDPDLSCPSSFWNAWNLICIRAEYQIFSFGRIQSVNPLRDFIGVMYRATNQECTDDRDKIYSMLGLQQDVNLRQERARMFFDGGLQYDHYVTDRFWDFRWAFLSAEEGDQLCASAHNDPGSYESVEDSEQRLGLFVGLFSCYSQPPLVLQPNYDASVTDVYTDFAWAYLDAADEDILQLCGISQHTKPVLELAKLPVDGYRPDYLPSWAADFRNRRQSFATPWNGGHFQAGKNLLPRFKLSHTRKQVAGIRGVIFDEIILTLPVQSKWLDSHEAFRVFRNLVTNIQSIAFSRGVSGSYLTGGTFDHALSRTLVADGSHHPLSKDDILRHWSSYKTLFLSPEFISLPPSPDPRIQIQREQLFEDAWHYHKCMLHTMIGNTFFFTSKGYIGLAPSMTKPFDHVALLDGTQTPFVIRMVRGTLDPEMHKPYHLIISPCYVHGVMHGEAFNDDRYNEGWGYIPFV